MGHIIERLTDDQRADKIAVSSFFYNHDKDYPPFFNTTHWNGKKRTLVTLKDLILYAMKEPTDKNGKGGNSIAQTLFKHYDIYVERNHKHPDCKAPENAEGHKKQFYDAWYKVRESEAEALRKFYLLRDERNEIEAKGYFPSWRHSHMDKLTQNNGEKKSEDKTIPETRRSLVSLVKASRTGFFTRLLASVRCPTFFSGNRTYSIFKTPATDTKVTGDVTIFGVDTRKAKSSEEAAKKIIESIEKKLPTQQGSQLELKRPR